MDTGGRAAVFLDRDGTINVDSGYLSDPDALEVLDNAPEAIRLLNESGAAVIVVSNQSGVGRGYFTDKDVARVNMRLQEVLAKAGARIDGVYYCPHRPDDDCDCRKPKAGLIRNALKEHPIDPARSYVVGDKASDVEMARSVGAKGVLVLTGDGVREREKLKAPADCVARDLYSAVEWILKDMSGRGA